MTVPDPAPLVAAGSVAVACALLSVFVVARRWAFVGEGLGHAGYGGAGTAWMLAALSPALDRPWLVPAAVVGGCLVAAGAIGRLGRRGRVSGDAAVGVLLVGSLAWGFLGRSAYLRLTGREPAGGDALLFGSLSTVSTGFAVASACVAGGVGLAVWAGWKEVVAYCLDPLLAETSGVRVGAVHYGLIFLLAGAVAAGVPVVGAVLVTALLVLPGATAGLVSTTLGGAVAGSVASATSATVGAALLHGAAPPIPVGPAVVLLLVLQFAAMYAASRARSRGGVAA